MKGIFHYLPFLEKIIDRFEFSWSYNFERIIEQELFRYLLIKLIFLEVDPSTVGFSMVKWK